jgi:hypothetical protein
LTNYYVLIFQTKLQRLAADRIQQATDVIEDKICDGRTNYRNIPHAISAFGNSQRKTRYNNHDKKSIHKYHDKVEEVALFAAQRTKKSIH